MMQLKDNKSLKIRPLLEVDLDEADRIMRLAFGTFTEQPDPNNYRDDAEVVRPRWRADPESAFAAEIDGRLVGSNFVARWGSFGFIGPLSIDPAYWDRGLAKYLVVPVLDLLDRWEISHAELFTFSHSTKHIGLYQKFGFRPGGLTVIFEKEVDPNDQELPAWTVLSQWDNQQRHEVLGACRRLTDKIYDGLDVTPEIESIAVQNLGDTLLMWRENELQGFAACHVGTGTEAGKGICFVKIGAVAPGVNARDRFKRLLLSIEIFAKHAQADQLVLGVNTSRREAYEETLSAGFQMFRTGIAMHRPDLPGFSRAGDFVIGDLR
jgi:RimJ/RimL family protein N-acetyltransferase